MTSVEEIRYAFADTDMDELPGEWELLKHVRDELEGSKRELKANAHKRLELGAAGKLPPLTAGQVVEQKIFHILIDRPIVKERITTRLQRTFYEREYVRVTKLVNEVQLPTTVEHLGREKILLEGDQGKSLTDGDTQGVHPQSKTPSVAPTHQAAGQNRSLPNGAAGKGGLVPSPQGRAGEEVGGGGIPDTDLKRLSGKGKGPSKSGGRSEASANPFKGFVQPGAEVPPTHELQKQDSKRKPRSKIGLRWCFAAPFTHDGAIPQPHRSQLNVEVLSQGSTQDPTSTYSGLSRAAETGLSSHQNDHPNGNGTADTLPPSEGLGGGKGVSGSGDTKSPHEAAVKAALQAGADESQREIFTQVEEVAVTTETIERFVEHNYFQREYVIAVIYKGETLSTPYYETLHRERFLKPSPETAGISASP